MVVEKKSIPVLWLDLCPDKCEEEPKLFFPYLTTQSHPWGYRQDGVVLPWNDRSSARIAFKQPGWDDNYTSYPLKDCFPWQAKLPVPLAILLECATDIETNDPDVYWQRILGLCDQHLPHAWKIKYSERISGNAPISIGMIQRALRKSSNYTVHINILSQEAATNDAITEQDNSLLFVRLNTGGVTLGGEELVFSMFKSYFPEAKNAVENAAVGFMAPSKLFGLLVRLVAAKRQPNKLSQPVTLREFKRDIVTNENFKVDLRKFIQGDVGKLMLHAQTILTGPFDFCLPNALATRTINESPDVFLALLYWLQAGGNVVDGGEEHRRLLGRFTALSWFMQGNARQRHEVLREWVQYAGADVVENLWNSTSLRPLFMRVEYPVPVLPDPEQLTDFLLKGVLDQVAYDWDAIGSSQPAHSLWGRYGFLPPIPVAGSDDQEWENQLERIQQNLMQFLGLLWPCRRMLLFAQREYIRNSFMAFAQWEFALKDTNCPWDWDHIYPSAYNRKKVNPKYRDWHNTIGNLRAVGLSDNRGDGCDWPKNKLAGNTPEQGEQIRRNSFVPDNIWQDILKIDDHYGALMDDTALSMCRIVLLRVTAIYCEWYDELQIGEFMKEICDPTG